MRRFTAVLVPSLLILLDLAAPALAQIPPSAWSVPIASTMEGPMAELAQARLSALGCYTGPATVDGVWGRRSAAAARRWQNAAGVPATGVLSQALVESIADAANPPACSTAGANSRGERLETL
jgi:peptidoglycan hydrolase-like protein with peptidoglycan-binding domain